MRAPDPTPPIRQPSIAKQETPEYLLTVKNNRRTLRKNIANALPVPPTVFFPSGADAHADAHRGAQ